MRLWARALPAALFVGAVVLAIVMRMVSGGVAFWHVDPATARRTGFPNDYLVAPEGMVAARADSSGRVHGVPPRDLLAQFDAVAMAAPRTRRLAGAPDELLATYVQRSRIFGFPDYISARAVEVPGGSALIVWSRARFGFGDFGVNRARVDAWLARLDNADAR